MIPGERSTVTKKRRSEIMGRVGSKNTKPEIAIRKILSSMGYRYRLHRKDLPGKPDIAFMGKKKVVFINGCFWHRHPGCPNTRTPKSRIDYWTRKFDQNVARDKKNIAELKDLGWDTLIIWECEIAQTEEIRNRLRSFLEEGIESNVGLHRHSQ